MAARYSHNAIYYRCLFWWQSSSRHGMTALQWGGGNTALSFLMVDVELPPPGLILMMICV